MGKTLIIAGTHSGVGKTTITVGLIAALRRRGLTVQPFKVGPDYIDPTYHSLAAGRSCRNLDSWMLTPEVTRSLFHHASRGADVSIIEGVMGVFDGLGYDDETGSTAQVAKLLGASVILVLDASKTARSAAALALGYQRFDEAMPLAGFIVNRVGSEKHGQGVARAVEQATGLPVFGWLPREDQLHLEERHLGLIPTIEPGHWNEFVQAAADMVSRHLDLDRLLHVGNHSSSEMSYLEVTVPRKVMGGPRIAVARDEAFHFTYEENLEMLRCAGAELVFFSPLRDATLPSNTNGVLLSGGFPEVYAAQLAANSSMLESLRQAHRDGLPIYAECGGLMYLTESIVDQAGVEHEMAGLLPGRSVMSGKLTLGYRLATAVNDSWLLRKGETIRGHEFHYSIWEDRPGDIPPLYHVVSPTGRCEPTPEGACLGNLLASYVHLHFWGRPELAERFVQACIRGRKEFTTEITENTERNILEKMINP